jgi:predicted Zn-dependent protease
MAVMVIAARSDRAGFEGAESAGEAALQALRRGDFEAADRWVHTLREREPSSMVPDLLAGQLEFARQRYPSAEQWFRRALARSPEDSLVQVFLAESLLPQRRLSEATRILNRVSRNAPEGAAGALAVRLLEALRLGVFRPV